VGPARPLEGEHFANDPFRSGLRANLSLELLARLALLNAVERHHPREQHYYLVAIGTDPVHQGRGVGAALLAPVLTRCDAERMPAYLESSNERNVPFFTRSGFRVMHRVRVPDGPKITLMRRPARGE